MNSYKLRTRAYYAALSEDSPRLFNACWNVYRGFLRITINTPTSDAVVMDWLDTIATAKVNNPASTFYLYGK
jgi:hypothetical protein